MTDDRCDACGRSFADQPLAPMLIDVTWLKLADEYEMLCVECMSKRAIERRIDLTISDLLDCPFNHWQRPLWLHLFRDLFRKGSAPQTRRIRRRRMAR